MARSAEEPAGRYVPGHIRREDIIRPEGRRPEFTEREAQRRLLQKERRWAPVAYGVFFAALVVIFAVTYVTYAFSAYRGVILPGVNVDNVSLAGMSSQSATSLIWQRLGRIGQSPVIVTYGPYTWNPSHRELGVTYDPTATVQDAMAVGRQGSFIEQLFDRLPFHISHPVGLVYHLREPVLRRYIFTNIAGQPPHGIAQAASNAQIAPQTDRFILRRSISGQRLDFNYAEQVVHSILGSLHKETRRLRVIHISPAITDADAQHVLDRVNGFLAHPPVIAAGRRVFVMRAGDLVPMLSFHNEVAKNGASIRMTVSSSAISSYISTLAAQVDRQPQNARFQFSAGQIVVLASRRTGRTLDQAGAYRYLLAAITSLRSGARLRLSVATTQPPVDVSNPASLGIDTLLAEGSSSFAGSGDGRLNDVINIAKVLNQDVVQPNADISFNTLTGSSWPARVYDDRETLANGQLVPGRHGAMQQVATAFLRAMYSSGLKVLERHAHPYRLPWYEPPVGLDAVVDPGQNVDLRFHNTTGSYLLIETRVEPVRHEIYIYVYGKNQRWKVSVDPLGKVLKIYPHGPTIMRPDPSLAPDQIKQIAWPHDGADTVVQRTITYPNGKVSVDEIDTHYSPWQGIMLVGKVHKHGAKATPTPGPTPPGGAAPSPSPTPTFSH